MPEPRKLRVFLCHASQDKPVVRELYRQLLAEGWIDPWLDEEKLLPGQDWDLEIEKAVESADIVIACLSNASVNKRGYVQKEIKFAIEIAQRIPSDSIFIIPLRLNDCSVPSELKKWHWGDFFPVESREKAYKLLLSSLKEQAGKLGKNFPFLFPTGINVSENANMFYKIKPISKKEVATIGNVVIYETTFALEMDKKHRKFFNRAFVEHLLSSNESSNVEFKIKFPWDLFGEIPVNDAKQFAELVAGYMNTNGGILLIGLDDHGKVIGINDILPKKTSNSEDGIKDSIVKVLSDYLDVQCLERLLIEILKFKGKLICGIRIPKSGKPVFIKYTERYEFNVRYGNATIKLDVKDAVSYVTEHWTIPKPPVFHRPPPSRPTS